MTIKRVKYVTSSSVIELEKKVNIELRGGWELHGAMHHTSTISSSNVRNIFAQTMVQGNVDAG